MNTKTSMTYQTATPPDNDSKWTTVISDIYTGAVYKIKYTSTEQEGRDWANAQINGTPNPHGGWSMPTASGDPVLAMWDDDYVPRSAPPPPQEEKPTVPVTCYVCGAKLDVAHQWNYWTNELTLEIKHCGKKETKQFTLTQAKELANIGWMAFLA